MADAGTPPVVVDDGTAYNDGALVVKLSSTWLTNNTALLKDLTDDTVDVEAGFATGVATLTSKTLAVEAARVGSELVIEKVIFDEGAETFEIIPVSPGQFSGSVTYDWSGMTLTDGSINLPLNTLQEQGPSGGAQIVNGNIVFNIMSSEIAALKTMLEDGTPDGIVITSAFSAGQTQLVAETQANSPLPVQLPSVSGNISVKEVMFDPSYGSLELVVDDASVKFTGTPTVDNFNWDKLAIKIDDTLAPLTGSDIEALFVTSGGDFDGNLMIKLKDTFDTSNLDGQNTDNVQILEGFVKAESSVTPVAPWDGTKTIMTFHQPEYPTDPNALSYPVFAALGTDTWMGSSDVSMTWNISNYGVGLDETVAANDTNGLSEKQEQFIADVVEGVFIDELSSIKYDTDTYAVNAQLSTSKDHPVYVTTDGDGGPAEDLITFIEEGMYVEVKGQFVASADNKTVTGAVMGMSVYTAIQNDSNPPQKDGAALFEMDTSSPLDYATVISTVPDIT